VKRSIGIVVLAGVVAAAGAETVRIGGVDVPADCPLVRGEHPRLLFTRADIPILRRRLARPEVAAELARARKIAAEGKASAVLLGVLHHLTGEPAYLTQASAKLRPGWSQTYALAADLVMAGMSPDQQRAEAGRLVTAIRANRWRPHVTLALAAWGHGQDEYLEDVLARSYREDLVRGVAYNNTWSAGRGGSSMSHGYNGEHFYTERFTAALAWTTATGQDWVGRCDFAAHTPAWYIFHYRPWEPAPACVHVGVTAMCRHWQTVTPAKFEGDNLAVLAASRFHDGLGQWWIRNVISKVSMGWGDSAVGHGGLWGKLLWLDPNLPAVDPNTLPPARLFPENGHVVMRSDWSSGATYALFRCGRFGEIDGHWGRNNADNLHFLIGRRGILAADTGAVHSLNNTALGFAGARSLGEGRPHMTHYARQTVAHNSITVGREAFSLKDYRGRELAVVVRGGQSPIQQPTWWKAWGLKRPQRGARAFREGRIVAYETSPLLDYAAGDATHSYPPSRVKAATRQFLYLRPATFVVFDRVTPAADDLEVIWNLHSLYEPAWDAKRRADHSLPADRQFIVAADGRSREANPSPGGRYVHTGDGTFTIDDRRPGMTGRLFVRPLLPADPDRTIRTIGGPWHEFEVNGVNYGPTAETYGRCKGAANKHNLANSIGVGGWRIEISHDKPGGKRQFLAVLHAADRGTLSMPTVRQTAAAGGAGAQITIGPRVYEVTFTTTGPLGGQVKVTENGKATVHTLARTVADHYGAWSTHPHWRTWRNLSLPKRPSALRRDEGVGLTVSPRLIPTCEGNQPACRGAAGDSLVAGTAPRSSAFDDPQSFRRPAMPLGCSSDAG